MSGRLSFSACRLCRRIFLAAAVAGLLFAPGVSSASEAVSNRFDLFVPVSLSVLEVSQAVGLVPVPVVACAAANLDVVAKAVQEVVR